MRFLHEENKAPTSGSILSASARVPVHILKAVIKLV